MAQLLCRIVKEFTSTRHPAFLPTGLASMGSICTLASVRDLCAVCLRSPGPLLTQHDAV